MTARKKPAKLHCPACDHIVRQVVKLMQHVSPWHVGDIIHVLGEWHTGTPRRRAKAGKGARR